MTTSNPEYEWPPHHLWCIPPSALRGCVAKAATKADQSHFQRLDPPCVMLTAIEEPFNSSRSQIHPDFFKYFRNMHFTAALANLKMSLLFWLPRERRDRIYLYALYDAYGLLYKRCTDGISKLCVRSGRRSSRKTRPAWLRSTGPCHGVNSTSAKVISSNTSVGDFTRRQNCWKFTKI